MRRMAGADPFEIMGSSDHTPNMTVWMTNQRHRVATIEARIGRCFVLVRAQHARAGDRELDVGVVIAAPTRMHNPLACNVGPI